MASNELIGDGSTDRQQVWISGEEVFLLIHELLDPNFVKEERATGRTIRLALKYAEIAMKVAPARVLIEDHHPTTDAKRNLTFQITRVLDLFGIAYQMQEVPQAVRDANSFTGTTLTGEKCFYVRAWPKGIPDDF